MSRNRQQRRKAAAIARKQKEQQRAKIEAHGQQPKQIAFTCPLKVAAQAAAGERRRFSMDAYTGEPLQLDGFNLPIIIDIASADFSAQLVPALHQHEQNVYAAVGQIDTIQPATIAGLPGIVAGGYFTPTDHPGDTALAVIKKIDAGQKFQASVGGNQGRFDQLAAGQKIKLNGREYVGPALIARNFRFKEISFVLIGADEFTSVSAKSSKVRIKGSVMKFEEWLSAQGFEDAGSMSETLTANMKRLYAMEHPAEEEEPEEVTAQEGDEEEEEEEPPPAAKSRNLKIQTRGKPNIAADAANDARRVHKLTSICATYKNPEIEVTVNGQKEKIPLLAHAIEQKWTADKTELAAIRIDRGPGPAVIVKTAERDAALQALSGALLLRAGGQIDYKFKRPLAALALNIPRWLRMDLNAEARDRVMNAAHHYSQYSAYDIVREACRLDGIDVINNRDEMIRAAIKGPSIRAAGSGSALSNIFSTSVHAQLLRAYEQAGDTTVGWVSEAEVANFQTQERTRIDLGGGLKKLPRGKTAEHADYTDSQETYKIASYAKMFEVSDDDFLDDNLGGLATVPTEMGTAASRLRPDMVYAIILDNANLGATARQLFNTTDGSLAGTAGALSAARLTTAISDMARYRENSVVLNLQPTHLLVGPENELLAWELTQSPQILYGADDETIRGNLNALNVKGIQPVTEGRLSLGVTDPRTGDAESGSTTAWYLVCNTAHTIEVGYLRGTGRAPKVRSYTLEQGRWGLGWDVKMSLGAAALDWKGFHKNAGA
jgi:hypothetical protein